MSTWCRRYREAAACTLLFLFQANVIAALRPETVKAWEEYVRNANQRRSQSQQSGCFEWTACSPDLRQAMLAGQIVVRPIKAVLPGMDVRVPGGDIHHVVGGMFLKGEKSDRIRRILDNYAH